MTIRTSSDYLFSPDVT